MTNARLPFIVATSLFLAGCGRQEAPSGVTAAYSKDSGVSLREARQGFKTKLTRLESAREPVPVPPPRLFRPVHYDAAKGRMAAYLSPDPHDGRKHAAIIWITGGDCNTIGDVWTEAPASNDQTASAFRKAGLIMMFPSLRGGSENPGFEEGFFGEVDDVLSAAEYLAKQDYVDPQRIYLGGHSTGGTLVLLVAESSDRFRAVFSFGPVEDVAMHRPERLPFDTSSRREFELRAPIRWLHAIKSPTFVFEGASQPSNLRSLKDMARASTNPMVHFLPVPGANHFSILAPTTQLIADKLSGDHGAATSLTFSDEELRKLLSKR